jgi:8-oxo-dGTP diphosphatase
MTENKPYSSGALITDGKKWLFMLRDDKPEIPDPNKWGIIGGGGEPGENPDTTLIREIKEEIGVSLQTDELCYLGTVDGEKAGSHTKHLYSVQLNTPQRDAVQKGSEGQRLKWLNAETIAEMLGQDVFVPDLPTVIRMHILQLTK